MCLAYRYAELCLRWNGDRLLYEAVERTADQIDDGFDPATALDLPELDTPVFDMDSSATFSETSGKSAVVFEKSVLLYNALAGKGFWGGKRPSQRFIVLRSCKLEVYLPSEREEPELLVDCVGCTVSVHQSKKGQFKFELTRKAGTSGKPAVGLKFEVIDAACRDEIVRALEIAVDGTDAVDDDAGAGGGDRSEAGSLLDWAREPSNRFCADCGMPRPSYASINFCVVICSKCAKVHESDLASFELIGPNQVMSRVHSEVYTADRATKSQIEMLVALGNDRANSVWNPEHDMKIGPDADPAARTSALVAKYGYRAKQPQLESRFRENIGAALFSAVGTPDLCRSLLLIHNKYADVTKLREYCDPGSNASILWHAKIKQQLCQVHLLKANGFEERDSDMFSLSLLQQQAMPQSSGSDGGGGGGGGVDGGNCRDDDGEIYFDKGAELQKEHSQIAQSRVGPLKQSLEERQKQLDISQLRDDLNGITPPPPFKTSAWHEQRSMHGLSSPNATKQLLQKSKSVHGLHSSFGQSPSITPAQPSMHTMKHPSSSPLPPPTPFSSSPSVDKTRTLSEPASEPEPGQGPSQTTNSGTCPSGSPAIFNFSDVDTNNDGVIDRAEFSAYQAAILQQNRQHAKPEELLKSRIVSVYIKLVTCPPDFPLDVDLASDVAELRAKVRKICDSRSKQYGDIKMMAGGTTLEDGKKLEDHPNVVNGSVIIVMLGRRVTVSPRDDQIINRRATLGGPVNSKPIPRQVDQSYINQERVTQMLASGASSIEPDLKLIRRRDPKKPKARPRSVHVNVDARDLDGPREGRSATMSPGSNRPQAYRWG